MRQENLLRRLIPLILIGAVFLFFALRQEPASPVRTPEDLLIEMVVASGEGEVERFLACFGGELEERLRGVVRREGEDKIADWLRERSRPVKGFAILDKEPQEAGRVLVKTETVYQDRNTRQSFLLEERGGGWKIVQSDSEMVGAWDTDFGKPIWEVR